MSLSFSSSTPWTLAGKLIPGTQGLANGSMEATIKAFPGDLALLALMAVVVPPLFNEVLSETVPRKWRKTTRHLEAAARVSGIIYAGNVLDAVFATALSRTSLTGRAAAALYALLWWLPSRVFLGQLLYQRLRWMADGGTSERGYVRRAIAVGSYFGLALLVTDGFRLAVSQVFGFVIMPTLVALVGV